MDREELEEVVKEIEEKVALGRTLSTWEQRIKAYTLDRPGCHHSHHEPLTFKEDEPDA